MKENLSLKRIIRAVEQLALPKRKRAVQGRKAVYSDELIIALAVYQHLGGFRYATSMLENLREQG